MIGQRIRKYRKAKKLTLVQLAKTLKISHSALSQIETGVTQPSASTIQAFSEHTDIGLKWLLEEKGEMVDPKGRATNIAEMPADQLQPFELGYFDTYIKVDIYHEIGAGKLVFYDQEEEKPEPEPIGEAYVPEEIVRPGLYFFKVLGDCMYPVVREGALVGLDTKDKEPAGGAIFGVNFRAEGSALKYVFPTHRGIMIQAENRVDYPDVEVLQEEFEEIADTLIIGRLRFLQQVY